MSSPLDIISAALQKIGVSQFNETPSADEAKTAFASLNMMLEQWTLEDLMIYYKLKEEFQSIAGTVSYTIGKDQTWDTERPTQIISAYTRVGVIDYPMDIISAEEYQNISMKMLQSVPRALYYSPEYPYGTVWLYPVPSTAYTIGLLQNKSMEKFTSMSEEIVLPQGYLMALIYNLAVEIFPEYKGNEQISQLLVKKALDSKGLIKRKNQKEPVLNMESVFLGHGVTALGGSNGRFNIFSGF
jgi:hypothetical protein